MKDAETAEHAQGVVDYETRRHSENKHGVEASVSSHSYNRSESGVRVDWGSDGLTDENVPDGNGRTNDWNVRGGGACRRTDCDQTEVRTVSRSTLHY